MPESHTGFPFLVELETVYNFFNQNAEFSDVTTSV